MRGITKIITKLAKKYPGYRPPRLADHKGDLDKRWYIDYYVPNTEGNIIRKQYTGMNKFQSLKERYEHSHFMLREISKLLKAGYITEQKNTKPKKQKAPTLYQYAQLAYSIKKKELRKRSADYYDLFSRKIQALPEGNIRIDKITRVDITRIQAALIDSGLSPKSVNNHMGVLSSIINMAIDDELIQINPFRNIRSLKFNSGKHYPYSAAQLQKIREYLENHNPQLLLYISFIYYTLARPNEIRQLKVGDLRKDQVWFRVEQSKYRKSRYTTIPTHLKKMIDTQEISEFPDHYYIFGQNGIPSTKVRGTKYFYRQHVQMLKELKFTDKPYDLYSYKHSGAIALVIAGVDIKYIQNQCGHSTVAQTDQYLKDIGAIRGNQELIEKYPKM